MSLFLSTLKENFFAERSRWFPWVSVLFAMGIAIYFALPIEPSLWVSLFVIEAIIITAYFMRFSQDKLLLVAAMFLIALGFVSVQLKATYLNKTSTVPTNEKIYITAQVEAMDYNYRGMPRLIMSNIIDFDGNIIDGKIRVVLSENKTNLRVGDCAEMITELKPPMYPSLVGGYQFARKMYFQGISSSGFVMSRALSVDCKRDMGLKRKAGSFIANIRRVITERIYNVLPKEEAGVASAILAGQRGLVSDKIYNQYRDSGLAHFLSISGLHMSMIAGLVFFLVRLGISLISPIAVRYDSKKIAAVMAIGASFVYLLISGAEIPAKRAFIMTTIVLVGVLYSRTAISMITISWAAFIILAVSPEAIVGPSFQMSFAAVVCLIAFYEKYAISIRRFLNGEGYKQTSLLLKIVKIMWVYLISILVADLVASLATLPFAIYHFNRIALFTTIGNILAGPIIALIIMPAVLFSLILMPLGLEYYPLKIVGWGVGLVNDITVWVSSLPNAAQQIVSMPLWSLVLIVFGGLWLCIWTLPWRRWGGVAIILGFAGILLTRNPDVIVNAEADLFAVKTEKGQLVILPSRGNRFDKKIWLEKNASLKSSPKDYLKIRAIYKGETTDKEWLDLSCDESSCVYKGLIVMDKSGGVVLGGKPLDTELIKGASFYINGDKVKIKTVKGYVGDRFWYRGG